MALPGTEQEWVVTLALQDTWKEEDLICLAESKFEDPQFRYTDYQNPVHILQLWRQKHHHATTLRYSTEFVEQMMRYNNNIIQTVFDTGQGAFYPIHVQMDKSDTLLLSIVPHIVSPTLKHLRLSSKLPPGMMDQDFTQRPIPLIPIPSWGRVTDPDKEQFSEAFVHEFMYRLCYEFAKNEILECNPNCIERLADFVIYCMMNQESGRECISRHVLHVCYHFADITTLNSVCAHLEYILDKEWLNDKDLFLFLDHAQVEQTTDPDHMQSHISVIHLSADRKVATLRCSLFRTWENDTLYQEFAKIITLKKVSHYQPFSYVVTYEVATPTHCEQSPFCSVGYCVNESIQFLIVRLSQHYNVRPLYEEKDVDGSLLCVTHGVYVLFYNFLIDLRNGKARDTLQKHFHFSLEPTIENVHQLLVTGDSQQRETLLEGMDTYFEYVDPSVAVFDVLNTVPILPGKGEYLRAWLREDRERHRSATPSGRTLPPTYLTNGAESVILPVRPNELTVHAMITGMFYALLYTRHSMKLYPESSKTHLERGTPHRTEEKKWVVTLDGDDPWEEEYMTILTKDENADYQNPLDVLRLWCKVNPMTTSLVYSSEFAQKMVDYHDSIIRDVYLNFTKPTLMPLYIQMNRSSTLLLSIVPFIVPQNLPHILLSSDMPKNMTTRDDIKLPPVSSSMIEEETTPDHVLQTLTTNHKPTISLEKFMLRLCHEFSRTEIITCTPNCVERLTDFIVSCMMKEQTDTQYISRHVIHVQYEHGDISTLKSACLCLTHILTNEWKNNKDLFVFIIHYNRYKKIDPTHMGSHLSIIHLSADRKVVTLRCTALRTWENDKLYQAFEKIIGSQEVLDTPTRFVVAADSYCEMSSLCFWAGCVNESLQFLILTLTKHPNVRDLYKQDGIHGSFTCLSQGMFVLFYNFLIDLRDGKGRETLQKYFHFQLQPDWGIICRIVEEDKHKDPVEFGSLLSKIRQWVNVDEDDPIAVAFNLLNMSYIIPGLKHNLYQVTYDRHERKVLSHKMAPTYLCTGVPSSTHTRTNDITVHAMITGMFYTLLLKQREMTLVRT